MLTVTDIATLRPFSRITCQYLPQCAEEATVLVAACCRDGVQDRFVCASCLADAVRHYASRVRRAWGRVWGRVN